MRRSIHRQKVELHKKIVHRRNSYYVVLQPEKSLNGLIFEHSNVWILNQTVDLEARDLMRLQGEVVVRRVIQKF